MTALSTPRTPQTNGGESSRTAIKSRRSAARRMARFGPAAGGERRPPAKVLVRGDRSSSHGVGGRGKTERGEVHVLRRGHPRPRAHRQLSLHDGPSEPWNRLHSEAV